MHLYVIWKHPEKHTAKKIKKATFDCFGVDSITVDGKTYEWGSPEWWKEIKEVYCLGEVERDWGKQLITVV